MKSGIYERGVRTSHHWTSVCFFVSTTEKFKGHVLLDRARGRVIRIAWWVRTIWKACMLRVLHPTSRSGLACSRVVLGRLFSESDDGEFSKRESGVGEFVSFAKVGGEGLEVCALLGQTRS